MRRKLGGTRASRTTAAAGGRRAGPRRAPRRWGPGAAPGAGGRPGQPLRAQKRRGGRAHRGRRVAACSSCPPTPRTSTPSRGPSPNSKATCAGRRHAPAKPWRPPSRRAWPPSAPATPKAGSSTAATAHGFNPRKNGCRVGTGWRERGKVRWLDGGGHPTGRQGRPEEVANAARGPEGHPTLGNPKRHTKSPTPGSSALPRRGRGQRR